MRNNSANTNISWGINVSAFCVLIATLLFYINSNPLFGQAEEELSTELLGRFKADKTEYILEEPIYITFTMTNVSDTELYFIIRESYSNSFRFMAKDNKGNPVPQLAPSGPFGGWYPWIEVLPGKNYTRRLLLNKYCLIEKPDVYTVDCKIELVMASSREDYSTRKNRRKVCIKNELSIKVNPGDTDKLKQILEKLKLELKAEDEKVRAVASEGLSFVPNELVVPYLIEALDNDDIAVQRNAVAGLGRLGNQDCVKALIKTLADTDNYVTIREKAAGQLGRLKAKESLKTLYQVLNDKDAEVREYVIRALGAIGDPSSISEIKKRLNDPDEQVRKAAEEALRQIKQITD